VTLKKQPEPQEDRDTKTIKWLVNEVLFFTWWVQLQKRVNAWTQGRQVALVVIAVSLGAMARLWAQTRPGNWDFYQWINTSTAVLQGEDPYTLYGYNYPPPWVMVLALFNKVTSSDESFRLLISLLMIVVDIGIAYLLFKRGYTLAAALFSVSPILIAISGQHQQVDGITVFLALSGMVLAGLARGSTITRYDWGAVLLLGASLSFKPVFLVFPIWLAMRPGPWRRRLFYLIAPGVVFFLSIATAFVSYPASAVIQKIFFHNGMNDSPILLTFSPHQIAPWLIENGVSKIVFLVLLIAAGLLFRKMRPFELTLVYAVSALTFSWAFANQYMASSMAGIAIFLNLGLFLWLLLASLYVIGDVNSLGIPPITPIQKNVVLDYVWIGQDLFPWLFIGWILMVLGLSKQSRHMTPSEHVRASEDS
jgi:hypothetical protein